ncbi:MAG: TRAP transporter small permease subunit [Reyranella sp.]|nr:TRAP transporter small permease subunit [Reyranella sp.]
MERLLLLLVRVREGSRRLAWLAVFALLVVSLAVTLDVALRFLFDAPIHGLEDIVALAMIVAVVACFPAGFALGSNITVRFAGRALGGRWNAWLETFGQFVSLAFVSAVAWQLVVNVGDIGGRTTFMLQWPVAPAWYAAAGLAILAALAQALVAICHLLAAVVGAPPPAAAESSAL